MTTMKSHTDLPQSKKLAEFLPPKSADMFYTLIDQGLYLEVKQGIEPSKEDIPCWSLAALLDVLPKIVNNESLFIATSAALWHISYKNIYTAIDDNLIDACYEMIIKLHELKLL